MSGGFGVGGNIVARDTTSYGATASDSGEPASDERGGFGVGGN